MHRQLHNIKICNEWCNKVRYYMYNWLRVSGKQNTLFSLRPVIKCLFMISVKNGRMFTLSLRGSVNIVPLFTLHTFNVLSYKRKDVTRAQKKSMRECFFLLQECPRHFFGCSITERVFYNYFFLVRVSLTFAFGKKTVGTTSLTLRLHQPYGVKDHKKML